MSESPTALEQMICFELYATSRAVTGLYRPVLDALGLTYPQFVAMIALWQHSPTTVRDLGRRLDLDTGTLSPLLKRLENQGLIRRERGTTDERTVHVHLTDQGATLRTRVADADLMNRFACAFDLTLDEFQQLHHLLGRVRASATTNTL
jgi:DNA-binding MarR family transcriptional regulator